MAQFERWARDCAMRSFAFIAVIGSCAALLLGIAMLAPTGPQMGAPVLPIGLFLLVAAGGSSLCGCIAVSLVPKSENTEDRSLKLVSVVGYICMAVAFILIILGLGTDLVRI